MPQSHTEKTHSLQTQNNSQVTLVSVANESWEATSGYLGDTRPVKYQEISDQDYVVLANKKQLLSAIAGLYFYLLDRSLDVSLTVTTTMISGQPSLCCVCSSDKPIPKVPTPSDFESLRYVNQILTEHDARLNWEHTGENLIARVIFPNLE